MFVFNNIIHKYEERKKLQIKKSTFDFFLIHTFIKHVVLKNFCHDIFTWNNKAL